MVDIRCCSDLISRCRQSLSLFGDTRHMKPGRNLVVLTALVLILFAGPTASGQGSTCTLKLADLPQAPELMGFQMGMTKDQAKTRVPQIVFGRTDDLGVSKTTINPDFDPKIDKSSFGG